jgi:hypothetical protein
MFQENTKQMTREWAGLVLKGAAGRSNAEPPAVCCRIPEGQSGDPRVDLDQYSTGDETVEAGDLL